MRNTKTLKFTSIFAAISLLASCSTQKVEQQVSTNEPLTGDRAPASSLYDQLRGNLGEYDPGAPKNSNWVKLYSSAPNYRTVGKEVLGGSGEKFRWEMGPMWYRGRLGDNQVKAFVVGQEGAQDENVSNRAFTGSTGTKTQRFLNHMGLYRSYLFMNTFVYTINGQLDGDPKFAYLEQGEGVSDPELSPIVKYRHQLFDNMILANPETVSLFMGVGSGGKASLATWINARGGECSAARNLASCDTSGLKEYFKDNHNVTIANEILVIGVPHPGGASAANGGASALTAIIQGFTDAAKKVAKFKSENRGWMPHDVDDPLCQGVDASGVCKARIDAMNSKFDYKDAAIPYRDFAFGTNRRMGYDGTTSNRWGADAIQVFSDAGVYSDKSARYSDKLLGAYDMKASNIEGIGFKVGFDMPWEPPKAGGGKESSYDAGPCGAYDNHAFFKGATFTKSPCKFAELMSSWSEENSAQSPSFGPTSVYRGRLENAKILVLVDQESHDDFFSGRAATGETGQKLQTWLGKQRGIGSNYAILRTSPWDALDDSGKVNAHILEQDAGQIKKIAQEVIAKGDVSKIVTIGSFAADLAKDIASEAGISAEAIDSEVSRLAISAIPREDLPYHTRWWMGTSGNRVVRGNGGATKGEVIGAYHYYRIHAPKWNSKYPVPSLDRDTKTMISKGLAEL